MLIRIAILYFIFFLFWHQFHKTYRPYFPMLTKKQKITSPMSKVLLKNDLKNQPFPLYVEKKPTFDKL